MGRYRNKSTRHDPRGRKLSDEELEQVFDQLSEHMEELRDDRNMMLKVCSFNECDEGEDTFTIYLDHANRMNINRLYEHVNEFNAKTGYNVKVETETDEDGGTTWMLFLPLFVPVTKKVVSKHVKRRKTHNHAPEFGDLVKWTAILISSNVLGHLLNQQTLYTMVCNALQI